MNDKDRQFYRRCLGQSRRRLDRALLAASVCEAIGIGPNEKALDAAKADMAQLVSPAIVLCDDDMLELARACAPDTLETVRLELELARAQVGPGADAAFSPRYSRL